MPRNNPGDNPWDRPRSDPFDDEITVESILAEFGDPTARKDARVEAPPRQAAKPPPQEDRQRREAEEYTDIFGEADMETETETDTDTEMEMDTDAEAFFAARERPNQYEPTVRKASAPYLDDIFGEADADADGYDDPPVSTSDFTDDNFHFFDDYEYAGASPDANLVREVSEAIEDEMERARVKPGLFTRLIAAAVRDRETPSRETQARVWKAETEPEPDLRRRAKTFVRRCNSLALRSLGAFPIALLLALFTLLFEAGRALPFGIGRSPALASAALMILQIFVMALGVDILVYGGERLIRGAPSYESLVLVSNLVSLFAGAYSILRGQDAFLPYSAVAALSLTFSLVGERMYLQGLAATLRTASARELEKRSFISEYRQDMDRTLLKQAPGRARGFYSNLMQSDSGETAYEYFAPLVLVFCVLISAYAALTRRDEPGIFPRTLSALTAAAASFQAMLAFASPFKAVAMAASRRGIAIAGAGGVDDLFLTDGCSVADEDIYPGGTLSIGKVRILDKIPAETAIGSTASLIVASGGGLQYVFTEYLRRQEMELLRVTEFAFYEGGIGGVIDGDRVMTGSSAFMKLFRVRIPEALEQSNAVYTAVNGKLIAVFAVEYTPIQPVKRALSSLLRQKMLCYLTARDFNITPKMMNQKFGIAEDELEYLPIESTYAIGDNAAPVAGRAAALVNRGGLEMMAELVSLGRVLKVISMTMTILSVLASAICVVLVAILAWSGSVDSVRAGTLLLYMSVSALVSFAASWIMRALMKRAN
ncbi:MAG: hypothetical protein LBT36_06025 [Oscillospiraceae bacterium]|jgi:hypothetical protein|nr:hypothetical protein [Oscillospiraceae bacterium]